MIPTCIASYSEKMTGTFLENYIFERMELTSFDLLSLSNTGELSAPGSESA